MKNIRKKVREKLKLKPTSHNSEVAPALYKPLDCEKREFRLLRLSPSKDFSAPIECKIFQSLLDDHPEYEALSYVWGDPNITVDIFLQDQPRAVTTNLESALRHLRLRRKKRILWVDALCINQSHVLEKNHQVAQMREIYLSSKRVAVWLGEEGNAQLALNFCKRSEQNLVSGVGISHDRFRDCLDACDDLFVERVWWKRTWILQEVLHDKPVQVYIGKIQIELDKLCRYFGVYNTIKMMWEIRNPRKQMMVRPKNELGGFSSIYVHFVADKKPVERIMNQRSMIMQRDAPNTSLQITLQEFRSQQCTDPRDSVFAFLGMAALKYSIPINYNATKRTIFTLTMHALLPTSPNPFLWVESPDRPIPTLPSDSELPSWVPDWTTKQTFMVQIMALYSNLSSFDASRSRTDHMKYRPRGKIVSFENNFMQGVYVGVITAVHTTHICEDSDRAPYDTIKLINYDRDPAKRNIVVDEHTANSETSLKKMGFPSWGPYWGKVGDTIVVIKGSSTPLVLRKSGRHYFFVGVCWLIDSEFKGAGIPGQDDPGFSDIMRGALWDEIGKSCDLEKFWLK